MFALPKLIYPLTVLPNPSTETISFIKSKLFEFLWDSKIDRVKRETITNIHVYTKGGLKMIDIDSFIFSLKASWINRIFNKDNTGKWKHIYINKLNKYGGKLILESNLETQDINKLFEDNTFLKHVIISCNNFQKLNPPEKVPNQIIWHNKDIKVNSKTIFYKQWYDRGIKYLYQIYDFQTKHYLTFNALKNLYNIPEGDFLKYDQLVSCIPKKWKESIKYDAISFNNNDILLTQFFNAKQSVKFLYNYNLKFRQTNKINAQNKWQNIIEEKDLEWKNIYLVGIKSTIDQKLRTFQYKYLMRIIRTNDTLFKFNLVSTNLCDFCSMHTETPEHLFWDCFHTQTFWTDLNAYFKTKHINIMFTCKTVSFGILK